MKNSPMPPRKKPLQAKTPLPRGESELKRTEFPKRSQPLRSTPSPKLSGTGLSRAARSPKQRKPLPTSRPRVSREEVEARRLVAIRSNWACEGCDCEPATDWAHRRARSQSGPWDAANGLHLGRRCHSWQHANAVAARNLGWTVRGAHDFRAIPVQHAHHGLVLLHSDGSWTPISEIPDEEQSA